MPRLPASALLLLALLAPSLAGCTWFQPQPPPAPRVHEDIVQEAWVAESLGLSAESPYGHVRVAGPAVAVPVAHAGKPVGAVFLNASVDWRTDAIFQAKERLDLLGDLYVQAPEGAWQGLRDRQGWRAAGPADLAAMGINASAIYERASQAMPVNRSAAAPGLWVLNGTVTVRVEPGNFSLATAEGPFVFQRNATGFVAVEGRTIVSYTLHNNTVAASNDALVGAEARDPGLTDLQLEWGPRRVDVRINTPPFSENDILVQEDVMAKIASVELPRVAMISIVGYESKVIRSDFAEFRTANMTVTMAPG